MKWSLLITDLENDGISAIRFDNVWYVSDDMCPRTLCQCRYFSDWCTTATVKADELERDTCTG